jgi:transcriptional regulator with XRE-family HTH domain
MADWRRDLGEQIKNARIKMGLTQGEVASRAGIAASSLSYYETGKMPVNFETLIAIARTLQAEFDVRGYRLAPTDGVVRSQPVATQLGLDFDKENVFQPTELSIRPTRAGQIVIRAIAITKTA